MARFLRATLPQPSIAGADDRLDPLCYLQLGKDARDVFVFQIGTQVETQALGTVDYKVHIDLDSNAATVQISRNHAMTPIWTIPAHPRRGVWPGSAAYLSSPSSALPSLLARFLYYPYANIY